PGHRDVRGGGLGEAKVTVPVVHHRRAGPRSHVLSRVVRPVHQPAQPGRRHQGRARAETAVRPVRPDGLPGDGGPRAGVAVPRPASAGHRF
ncbi:hypothetical protein ABTM67_19375, partial [Acinetobacter baumannii]